MDRQNVSSVGSSCVNSINDANRINRGDVYFACLDPVVGSEQNGTRPCLVLQNNTGNRFSTTTIVAPITSRKKPELPTHVSLYGIDGLDAESTILLEQIRTIDSQRLVGFLGVLDAAVMAEVDRALGVSLGIVAINSN